MRRLLYGGCTTFKPLTRRLYLVNGGVKFERYNEKTNKRLQDTSLLKRVHSSHTPYSKMAALSVFFCLLAN